MKDFVQPAIAVGFAGVASQQQELRRQAEGLNSGRGADMEQVRIPMMRVANL